jgi:hypothetical protein
MLPGVMDRLLALIVILLFRDESGRSIPNVSPKKRNIRKGI